MIRKYYTIVCDVKGCQARTLPWRTRVGARQEAAKDNWWLGLDARKKERAYCPRHRNKAPA